MPRGGTLHREDLDADFPDNPVIVQHVSLHGGVLNSAALRRWGITADTPTPPGGVILRKDGSTEPDGLLMETAFLPVFSSLFTTPYRVDGPEGQHNWRGEQAFSQDTVNAWVKRVYDLGLQLVAHANGDAAIDKGLGPTNHTDFSVTPIDQAFVLWTAVNRLSRAGELIGEGQRVTLLEALKAITINAAYQYFEEDSKGSIEVGKLADLVILDANPMAIKDIQVVETIKEGTTIYAA